MFEFITRLLLPTVYCAGFITIVGCLVLWAIDGCRVGTLPFSQKKEMLLYRPEIYRHPRCAVVTYKPQWLVYGPVPGIYATSMMLSIYRKPDGTYLLLTTHGSYKRDPPMGNAVTVDYVVTTLAKYGAPIEDYEKVFANKATGHYHYYFTPKPKEN